MAGVQEALSLNRPQLLRSCRASTPGVNPPLWHRWLSIVPGGGDTGGLSAIRSLRVLRPLRTMSSFPGMRVIVQTILASLPMCGVVLLLAMYLFSIFAIFGVQSFAGVLKHRCAIAHQTH
jgi:hypothetical protein